MPLWFKCSYAPTQCREAGVHPIGPGANNEPRGEGVHAANSDALELAEGMARWAGEFLWPIGSEQRQRMLRNEYGGMNEVLVNLAAITKKDRYIETARLFEQRLPLEVRSSRMCRSLAPFYDSSQIVPSVRSGSRGPNLLGRVNSGIQKKRANPRVARLVYLPVDSLAVTLGHLE